MPRTEAEAPAPCRGGFTGGDLRLFTGCAVATAAPAGRSWCRCRSGAVPARGRRAGPARQPGRPRGRRARRPAGRRCDRRAAVARWGTCRSCSSASSRCATGSTTWSGRRWSGSVLANVLLVLGLAFIVGGLRHGTQRFGTARARMLVGPARAAPWRGLADPVAHRGPAHARRPVTSAALSMVDRGAAPGAVRALDPGLAAPARTSRGRAPARGRPRPARARGALAAGRLALVVLAVAAVAAAFVSDWFVHGAHSPRWTPLHISRSVRRSRRRRHRRQRGRERRRHPARRAQPDRLRALGDPPVPAADRPRARAGAGAASRPLVGATFTLVLSRCSSRRWSSR